MTSTLLVLLATSLDLAYTGHKYPFPHPLVPTGRACVIDFDRTKNKRIPEATAGEKAWTVVANAKYNYATGWRMDELETSLEYFDLATGTSRRAIFQSVKDESTLGSPGTWYAEFTVAPPKPGEILRCITMVRVKKGTESETAETSIDVNLK